MKRTRPRSLGTAAIFLHVLLLVAGIWICGCSSATQPSPALTHVRTASVIDGEPFGIAIKDGEIYISDGANGVIRKQATGGAITVVASGLHTPSAIAFLPDGDLVVADTGSHTIRRVKLDGSVSTVAGIEGTSGFADGPTGAATFNAPIGIAVAADGTIYVSDTYNDRIRLIREGIVSSLAGSSRGFSDGPGVAASFDTPLGIAVWDDKILVADSGNGRVRIVEPSGIVRTFIGGDERDRVDGSLPDARFVSPTSVTVDESGRIFVIDGNAIRVIGRRVFPIVETVTDDRRGLVDGASKQAQFSRPSGLAVSSGGELYVADSDNGALRILSDESSPTPAPNVGSADLPLATRWPYDPPLAVREVAGTLGEVRNTVTPDNKPVWFHNGLDIAGAYGETARFLRDETVLDPHSADNFGTAREMLRLPLLGYIHVRLGRDRFDKPFADQRFQFDRDTTGKLTGIRVRRGTRFSAGDALGTLNSMNHVHLIAGRPGHEINAFVALTLPGLKDSIPPVIEKVALYDSDWRELGSPIKLGDKTRIVVRAYDRMDGNSERRRLGVYRVGYQMFSNGSPLSDVKWTIEFENTPPNDAVRFVYADGSRSGYTPDTVFDYIATNHVNGDDYREDFLVVPPGSYTLRVLAADYFGNLTSKDVEVEKR